MISQNITICLFFIEVLNFNEKYTHSQHAGNRKVKTNTKASYNENA